MAKSRSVEGRYFCNLKQGFRLSDLGKNLKYFDTVDVTGETLTESRSIAAAIKAKWLIKITPQIEQKYGDLFDAYGINTEVEKSIDDIVTPVMVDNKTRAAQAAKHTHPVDEVLAGPPNLNDDVQLADAIGAEIVGDNIFGETGKEQTIVPSEDSGIISSRIDSKMKAVNLGVPESIDRAKPVRKLAGRPVTKIKVAKIAIRKK